MWNIHGKIYDLHSYLEIHPGGKLILESCKGDDDLTATFESYHAFCDMDKIKSIMKKYEVKNATYKITNISFNKNGFYKTLQNKIKIKLNKNTKGDYLYWLKILIQSIIFINTFIVSFYCHNLNIIFRIMSAIISGHMCVQVGFCAMHDASHMAISHNKHINEFISNLWNSIALWDSKMWMQHHVIRHHTFTGDSEKDPDVIHFKPFIRKSTNISNKNYWKFSLLSIFTMCIFPGMFIGQGLIYHLIWMNKKRLWKMDLSELFNISIWETIIKIIIIYSFIQSGSLLTFLAYAISQNISYAVCILPDHDTFETNQNHEFYNNNKDWGEIQVRNSGNFCNQKSWVCYLFGGINYQIEHHLFPTLCHIHFHKIKPIVMETCKDFNIPYVHHNSMFSAIKSTLKQYEHCSKY